MAFDSRCYDLAEVFLPPDASEEDKTRLSQAIQDAIEDWLLDRERQYQAEEDEEDVP